MSKDVKQLIESYYQARLKNDHQASLEFYAGNASLEYAGDTSASSFAGSADGRDEVEARITAVIDTWIWLGYEFDSVVVDGSSAAVLCSIKVQHVPTDSVYDSQLFDLFEFDDAGKIVRQVEFADTALIEKVGQSG